MIGPGIIGILLIIANIAFSYKGFTNNLFYESYALEVDKILVYKDYKRLITSCFLHANWMHLIFNMFALFIFSGTVENALGELPFLIIYFASMLGGGALELLVHKNHGEYGSVGASGAVFGIMFAAIALFPGMSIGFFFLPIYIPAWIYGLLFVGFSIYGIKSKRGYSAYEAHLGGALTGMIVAILFEPSALIHNYITILIITIPAVVFIYLIITRPEFLLIDSFTKRKDKDHYSIDHKYNEEKRSEQEEIDEILDKIATKGMKSLSRKEKERLDEYSKSRR